MRAGYLMHRLVHRFLRLRPAHHLPTRTDGAELGKVMVAEGLGPTVLPDYSVAGRPDGAGRADHLPDRSPTTGPSVTPGAAAATSAARAPRRARARDRAGGPGPGASERPLGNRTGAGAVRAGMTQTPTRTRPSALLVAALALATFTLAGCSGSGDMDGGSTASGAGDAPADASAQQNLVDGDLAAKPDEESGVETVAQQQALIRTGNVALRADDVGRAQIDVQKVVDQHAGQVTEEKTPVRRRRRADLHPDGAADPVRRVRRGGRGPQGASASSSRRTPSRRTSPPR